MGLVNFGIPDRETEYLKSALNLNVFVEGGTYRGGTAQKMSHTFNKVITIEKSDAMYEQAKEKLSSIENITMLKGDTREHLHHILKENDNILFWLDAHWSGGETYGENDECPLISELEIIFSYEKNHVILVDDARCFLSPPPKPHNYNNWPSLIDIMHVLPRDWEMAVFEDVIYIFPHTVSLGFKKLLQDLITHQSKSSSTLLSYLFQKVGM
ncbi:hypothetical protein GCM10025856_08490 [Methylophaga marina]|uniref:Class I SAM-dependent methyltransferase n=1 Tax=Methylophaga marina TaxID=45495 RepID=A0ABP3CRJ5_9GAMM|nr:hypothetical protein [Methylophaga marina]BDZ73130.1 hypothetical protein GCM10025856_08490 [Methylophaga marina]